MNDQTEQKELALPRRYLVHDEIEGFLTAKGVHYEFRIRVWRSESLTAVVLVSQITGGIHPRNMIGKIANYCQSALCGYPRGGMLMFDDEIGETERYASQYFFEFFGNMNRLNLFNPDSRPVAWSRLESLVGEKIER